MCCTETMNSGLVIKGCHAHGQAHSVARTVICSTGRTDEAIVHPEVLASPISSSRLIGQLSMSRSLASSGFCFFFIALLSLCLCCCWLWLFRVVVLRRVSIRTLSEPFVALCRLGSVGEVDAASFRTALRRPKPTRSHRDAGFSNREHDSDPRQLLHRTGCTALA